MVAADPECRWPMAHPEPGLGYLTERFGGGGGDGGGGVGYPGSRA